MKKFTALVVCLLAISVFAAAQSTPQIRQKTFEKIWKTVNEKFFDPQFGGVNWKAVRTRYAPLVAAAKTDAEFDELINKMLGEIKTSHLGIISPETLAKLKAPGATTGLGLREIDNQVVITRLLADSSAAKTGLKTGFVVQKIDGAEVKDLTDARRKLQGAPNTTVKLSYLDEKDALHETTLERSPLSETDKGDVGKGLNFYALFDSKRLTDGIGYLQFTSFVSFLTPRIQAAIESMKDAPGLIIDLRGNGGGDDDVGIAMANMFFERETQLMITRTRKGDDYYYKAKAAKNAYRGKIVILLDEHSGSASEQFAAGMQETGRAFVIGKTSEGADLDADVVELPNGALLLFPYGQPRTPKGVVIEGRGVVPDREVSLTRAELLAGRDAQLEAAIEYIKTRAK